MKKDLVEFVAQCPNCQQVKVEHQKPGVYAMYKDSNMKVGYDQYGFCYWFTSLISEF